MTIRRAAVFQRLVRWLMLVASFALGHAHAQTYTYGGGEVIANPEIVVVYWGLQTAGQAQRLDQFYQRLTSSPYFNVLAEYGTPSQKIGRASYVKSVAIRPNDGAIHVDTVETAREIDRQILAGTLPFPTANTLYVIHFGQFMDVVMGSNLFGMAVGGDAGIGFCAYHFSARTQVPTPIPGIADFGPKIRMAVIPDASRMPPRCSHGVSTFEAITFMATHEIVEATTNPDSVLVEMPPVVGANVQCNGVRIPVSTISPIGHVPPAANGLAPWAWTSSASQFCNPDEVSDSAACGTPALYSTTGAPDGNYRVSPIFLNSRGACTVPTGVVLAPPKPPRPPANRQCLAACQTRQAACLDIAGGTQQIARCNLAYRTCQGRC